MPKRIEPGVAAEISVGVIVVTEVVIIDEPRETANQQERERIALEESLDYTKKLIGV